MIYQKTIFVLFVITFASSNGIVRNDRYHNTNDNCVELRCSHAAGITDRLSKLALLPDFVTQTLMLLEDLMKEMENELHRSASFLMDQIEPSCESTVQAINKILKKKKKRSGRLHEELGMGIQPHNSDGDQRQDTATREDRYYKEAEEKVQFDHYNPDVSRDNSRFPPVSKNDRQRSDVNTKQHFSQEYGNRERWSPVTETKQWNSTTEKNHWSREQSNIQPDSNWNPFRENHSSGYKNRDDSQWSESSHFDQIAKPKPTSSKKKYTTNNKQGYTNSGMSKNIEQLSSPVKEPVCRGINKRSPFWVPGLDQWCQQNCAEGYCPKTHCVC